MESRIGGSVLVFIIKGEGIGLVVNYYYYYLLWIGWDMKVIIYVYYGVCILIRKIIGRN